MFFLLSILLLFCQTAFSAAATASSPNNNSTSATAIPTSPPPLFQQQPAPEHCKEAREWPLNGRTLVRDYRGRVLLMAFLSVNHCGPECVVMLSRLDSLLEQFPAVRVLVIAPDEQPPADVRAFAWRFPRIRFEHEHKTCPVWSWFRAAHMDQFIFDRCSRLSAKLPATGPRTPPAHATTLSALQQTLSAHPCGWCEYDWAKPAPEWPSLHPPVLAAVQQQQQQQQREMPAKKQQKAMAAVNKSELLAAFGTEVGSLKDRNAGNQKHLAFAERQRSVGSNHHPPMMLLQNNSQYNKKSKYQQQLPPYGQQQAAVHAYPGTGREWQQQRENITTTTTSNQNNGNTNNNRQQMELRSGGVVEQRQQHNAQWQQQQQERERLLREREELLRQRKRQQQQQELEERQRQEWWWAEQQQRIREQQQQPEAAFSIAHPQQQQPQQQQQIQPAEPTKVHHALQIQAATEAGWLQQQEHAGTAVRYANDPYGDRYQFALGQTRQRQHQKQKQQQQRRPSTAAMAQQQQQSQMAQISPAAAAAATRNGQSQMQQPPILPPPPPATLPVRKNAMGRGDAAAPDPAPLYPEGSETNDYYGYDDDDEWTTDAPLPSLQIPKPTLQPTVPTMPSIPHDFGFELPCAGFSDESCYQQQTQLRPSEVHRCCRGRILFTDQCVPGKCSNLTMQLCCIQRFLQAKLTCCSDERQGETGVGDRFSHCCHEHFVDSDDPCCPHDYAAEQWRSVHELCLPNVEMDLSNVRVPVPLLGTSLVTEYDFGKTDKWHFECHYGGHVQQYSYFEKSASSEEEDGEVRTRGSGGEIDV